MTVSSLLPHFSAPSQIVKQVSATSAIPEYILVNGLMAERNTAVLLAFTNYLLNASLLLLSQSFNPFSNIAYDLLFLTLIAGFTFLLYFGCIVNSIDNIPVYLPINRRSMNTQTLSDLVG